MSLAGSVHPRRLQTFLTTTTIAINVAVQGVASAHPGHGIASDTDSATHYLTEPTHGIGLAIIAIATIAAAIIIRRLSVAFRSAKAV